MSEWKCPKCTDALMHQHDVNAVRVECCEQCGGIWLNKGELNELARPHKGDLEYCSVDHIPEDRITDYICPVCPDSRLVLVNFIEYSEITLEYCRKCEGIWLDRGELDAINAELERLEEIPESWDHRIMVFLSKLPF